MDPTEDDENLMYPNYNLGVDTVDRNYSQFLVSLSAKANSLIVSSNPMAAMKSFDDFAANLKNLTHSSMVNDLKDSAWQIVTDTRAEILKQVGADKNVDDGAVHDNAAMLMVSFSSLLASQMDMDAQTARSGLRRALMTPTKTKIGKEFVKLDRVGKKWKSDVIVRTMWRSTNVAIATDTALMTMHEYGHNAGYIVHPDHNHPSHNIPFRIGSTEWSDLYDKHFHPNTRAFVSKESRE